MKVIESGYVKDAKKSQDMFEMYYNHSQVI